MNAGVQGLRGISIVLVVLFHLDVRGFGGGNLGVDVFFVISGFVITQGLLHEQATTGRVDLPQFFARRIRRLVPVSTVVIGSTLVYLAVTNPRVVLESIRGEAQAATVGMSNVWQALNGAEYGGARFGPFDGLRSPFSHLWSLALEEQFYVLFAPLVAVTMRSSGLRIVPRRRLSLIFALLAIASAATYVLESRNQPTFAFYLLESRGWQLLIGAILALVPDRRFSWPPWMADAVAGFGLLLLAVVVHGHSPGGGGQLMAPLIAIAAAALLISGVQRSTGLPFGRLLRSRPLTMLGAIAYPLYLWHWLVLLAVDRSWSGLASLARIASVVSISLGLAALSHRFIELPMRRTVRLQSRMRLTFVLGLGAIVVLFVAATASAAFSRDLPAESGSDSRHLPRDLQPSLEAIFSAAQPVMPECSRPSGPGAPTCMTGDLAGKLRIAIVGDSYAEQWIPTLARIGKAEGLLVVAYTRGGCHWVLLAEAEQVAACEEWRSQALTGLDKYPPDVVILAGHDSSVLGTLGKRRYFDAAATLPPVLRTSRIVVFGDTPVPDFDLGTCLVNHWSNLDRCVLRRSKSVDADAITVAREAADRLDAVFVDTSKVVCPRERCPPVRGNVMMYRDYDHLSVEFARTQSSQLASALSGVLR